MNALKKPGDDLLIKEFRNLIEAIRAQGFEYHKWFLSKQPRSREEILAHIRSCKEFTRQNLLALNALEGKVMLATAGVRLSDHEADAPYSQIPLAWLAARPHLKH